MNFEEHGIDFREADPDGQILASGGYDHVIKIWRKVPGFTEEGPAVLPPYSSSPDLPHGLDPAPDRPQDLPD